MILEQILVTHMAVFCYLVGDHPGGKAVLIDPAGDYEAIMEHIDKHDVSIEWIINTHGHWDHTAGNEKMIEKTSAKLLIHEGDAARLKGLMNKVLSRFLGGGSSPDPVQLLHDGDVIRFGEESLTVIHTPGHSEGSICLLNNGNIFTGDTLFTEGMGRTDLPGGSSTKIMNSIRTKILSLPDETVIWPGHHYGRFPRSTVQEQKQFYL